MPVSCCCFPARRRPEGAAQSGPSEADAWDVQPVCASASVVASAATFASAAGAAAGGAAVSRADRGGGGGGGGGVELAVQPPRKPPVVSGLLARAGLLAGGAFTPSDAPPADVPAAAAQRRWVIDEAAVKRWCEYDSLVRAKHQLALFEFTRAKGLSKKAELARAKDLKARAEREEQTRQQIMSELMLVLGAPERYAEHAVVGAPAAKGAVTVESYVDLCSRLVSNNLPHAGPLSPTKAMGVSFSDYLSAVDHHAQLTTKCRILT
jgi:hypothetical protein